MNGMTDPLRDLLEISCHASSYPLAKGQQLFKCGDKTTHVYWLEQGLLCAYFVTLEGKEFRQADASAAVIAEYSGLIFAALFGYYLFNESLDIYTSMGILLIIVPIALQAWQGKRQ